MKVLISGTSRGIGKAIAEEFLLNHHKVIGIDKMPSSIDNKDYTHIQQDIRDPLPEIKDVNIIIANAGVQDEKEALEVNLTATINFVEKYATSAGLKSVLFIASSSARNGAEFPLYSVSKGGIVTFMKNLALRLADRKVTVNSLSPGGVITPLNDHILKDEKLYEAVKNENLFHRWSSAEEIGKWAYFVTVINQSMTGEDVLIDNGEMLKSNFIW
ncbi:MAG: SDR family oxidoreductase [Bacilli bacterium]|nr:SDR family oxidoreductase [Bacilli bacterium]